MRAMEPDVREVFETPALDDGALDVLADRMAEALQDMVI